MLVCLAVVLCLLLTLPPLVMWGAQKETLDYLWQKRSCIRRKKVVVGQQGKAAPISCGRGGWWREQRDGREMGLPSHSFRPNLSNGENNGKGTEKRHLKRQTAERFLLDTWLSWMRLQRACQGPPCQRGASHRLVSSVFLPHSSVWK